MLWSLLQQGACEWQRVRTYVLIMSVNNTNRLWRWRRQASYVADSKNIVDQYKKEELDDGAIFLTLLWYVYKFEPYQACVSLHGCEALGSCSERVFSGNDAATRRYMWLLPLKGNSTAKQHYTHLPDRGITNTSECKAGSWTMCSSLGP